MRIAVREAALYGPHFGDEKGRDMTRVIFALSLIVWLMGCKKPYNPPAITGNGSYLVVEGVINSGADSTIIKLSRTVNVSNKTTANPVLNAIVTVENDQNVSFSLTDAGNGNYVSAGLNLDNARTYRLRIKTSDNKQYLSDLVPVKITPPIDSVGYNIINVPDTGIQVYANTHDPKNSTRYYRWDFSENWQFSAKYPSHYIADGSIRQRRFDELITVCYSNDLSSDIVLGSSAKLRQDLIYQSPVVFIRFTSEKIEDEYAILLHEYALTADAYGFWENLRKNTEQLGSIFDAQPSQLQGNIHCLTNPAEPVVGYVSACTVSSKRIFIYSSDLPSWTAAYPYQCNIDSTRKGGVTIPDLILNPKLYYILDGFDTPTFPSKYTFTTQECADCTIRGTKTPPPFWR